MTNNLADISAFESIQSDQHDRIGMSSMSVFNAFGVVVPDLVKEKHYGKVKFKYPTKEEAEKIMRGWHNAELKSGRTYGKVYYYVWANGQRFPFSKENAEKVIEQAKQVKIEEID